MYLLIAIVLTAVVILLAWRGIGSHTPGGEPGGEAADRPQWPQRPKPRPKSVAPDDDPDFLREIDRKLRGEDKSS
ncbi:hypothetical protein GIS00_11110 [Nakamurella sp. YIM 132087]|uniref:Uncharacterized protein n=1 Tax=Nakamurella alba TaxID=2665158 RepID=A0A7K1FK27_9ACTN|nr:hypothetical protein [Nakamurella alba]MTD14495.1 hypothetical protein [Nakamurella alba]